MEAIERDDATRAPASTETPTPTPTPAPTPAAVVVFAGAARIAAGTLAEAAVAAWRAQMASPAVEGPAAAILAFDRETGRVVDLDLRGSEAETAARYAPSPSPEPALGPPPGPPLAPAPGPPPAPEPRTGRGRPKLGVVAREVTLLPRHWDWLAAQPGGASVALRRLVEAARKADSDAGAGAARARTEAAYRFMSAMAGNLPGFEDAARALFAPDHRRLATHLAAWPTDIATEIERLLKTPSQGNPSQGT